MEVPSSVNAKNAKTYSPRTFMNKHLIVDAHEDLAFNAVVMGLDPSLSAEEKRQLETRAPEPYRGGRPMVGLPNLLQGNVRVVFATLYASPSKASPPLPGKHYTTPEQAEEMGREQLAYYANLARTD